MHRLFPSGIAALVIALSSSGACPAGELRALEPKPAPVLELADLGGTKRALPAWRGQVVLLNFWASWCTPCVLEMPSIRRLAEQMRGRPFVVLAVNVAEAQRRVARSAQEMALESPVLLDADGATFTAWGGKGLPTTFLIDRDGRMRYLGLGPIEWDGAEAVAAVEGLLGPEDGRGR
jgi:thiol-disulfide isomerase/thioredoxin